MKPDIILYVLIRQYLSLAIIEVTFYYFHEVEMFPLGKLASEEGNRNVFPICLRRYVLLNYHKRRRSQH